MSYAQEMKSLVSDIKTSTKDRLQFVRDNKAGTRELLSQFDKELKEMAQEMKNFLDKSEKDRMADFSKMIKDIQTEVADVLEDSRKLIVRFSGESKERAQDVKGLLARFDKEMKEIANDLKDLLAKSEQTRMADFRVVMKDIQSRISSMQKDVADLLSEYTEERKEAHTNWGVLSKQKRGMAAGEEAEEEVEKVEKKRK